MAQSVVTFRERPEYKRGRTGERLVAELLQQRGWFVLPSYDYSGDDGNKAPRLQGLEIAYVVPDLDVCKNGVRRWVEVKTKWKADYTRITRRDEHGFDLLHYHHYRAVRDKTGCEVWICVYEESTRLALIQNLSVLERPDNGRISRSAFGKGGGMFFFARSALRLLAALELQG